MSLSLSILTLMLLEAQETIELTVGTEGLDMTQTHFVDLFLCPGSRRRWDDGALDGKPKGL